MKSPREQELRWRLKWLEHQVTLTKKALEPFEAPAPQQTELVPGPPSPARKLSEGEHDYEEWAGSRRTRLEELEVPAIDDARPPPAFINSTMKKVRHACEDDGARMDFLFDLFFGLDYPARMEPPYPFNAFVKKWPELIPLLPPKAPKT